VFSNVGGSVNARKTELTLLRWQGGF